MDYDDGEERRNFEAMYAHEKMKKAIVGVFFILGVVWACVVIFALLKGSL